jgi:exonuclease SbcD
MTEHGVPMAGKDHEYTLASLYGAGADAVLLGHIHKHQAWNRTFQGRYQVIAYPGSPGRYHFGEIGNKYFLNWYLKSNGPEFAAIETPAQIMHSITFSGAPDLDELLEAAKQSTGKAVKISFSIDEEHNASVDRLGIEKMFLDAGATEVKIIGNVLPIQRQRAPGISTASLEERLKKWLEQTGTDSTGIFERYDMLISKDPEVIVNELLSQT